VLEGEDKQRQSDPLTFTRPLLLPSFRRLEKIDLSHPSCYAIDSLMHAINFYSSPTNSLDEKMDVWHCAYLSLKPTSSKTSSLFFPALLSSP
jgi:hypothetical protein